MQANMMMFTNFDAIGAPAGAAALAFAHVAGAQTRRSATRHPVAALCAPYI
jgi:hypothetical protein